MNRSSEPFLWSQNFPSPVRAAILLNGWTRWRVLGHGAGTLGRWDAAVVLQLPGLFGRGFRYVERARKMLGEGVIVG